MSMRTIDFRYRVLRRGVDFCRIRPTADGWPSIRMDNDAAIRTSLQGTVLPPEKDVDGMADEILVEMIIDGSAYSLGIFLPATASTLIRQFRASFRDSAFGDSMKI